MIQNDPLFWLIQFKQKYSKIISVLNMIQKISCSDYFNKMIKRISFSDY